MDVTGDGIVDILSGSYSRHESYMAGLFQVLVGQEDGGFAPAEALEGSNGRPLILPPKPKSLDPAEDDTVVSRICTRPTACDLDGDGHTDLVAGNFQGNFGLFRGTGPGEFDPVATMLEDEGGEHLRVSLHGDPCVVDWDGDGDLDILSGSGSGGVALAENVGTKAEPSFRAFEDLLEGAGHVEASLALDESGVTSPASSTRVWVCDLDSDGKLDLLVGDSTRLLIVAEGVSMERAREAQETYETAIQAAQDEYSKVAGSEDEELLEQASEAFSAAWEAAQEARSAFVDERSTGFVWYLRQL